MTLGAENYLGVGSRTVSRRGGVLAGRHGRAPGNRCPPATSTTTSTKRRARFTGWGVIGTLGTFLYIDAQPRPLPEGRAVVRGSTSRPIRPTRRTAEDVLDLLAAHPGTGRYVARKLCRRLIADEPPQALVETIGASSRAVAGPRPAAARSTRRSCSPTSSRPPGARRSSGRSSSRSRDARRRRQLASSASRSQTRSTVEPDTSSFLSRAARTGHNLFARVPPDGYGDRDRGSGRRPTPASSAGVSAAGSSTRTSTAPSATDDFRLDVLGADLRRVPHRAAGGRAEGERQPAGRLLDRPGVRPRRSSGERDELDRLHGGRATARRALMLNLDASTAAVRVAPARPRRPHVHDARILLLK